MDDCPWLNTTSQQTLALNISPLSRLTTPLELTLTLDNVKINTPSAAKYLGILIIDQFSFKSQIAHLESKISRSVGVIAKLRYYLPPDTSLNLYFAIVHSHLLYGLPMWASTCKTYLTKLKKLHNKAIKIITKTCLRERVSPCYYKLQILNLDDLYQFELAKLMYQFTHNKLPSRFCNCFAYFSDSYSYATRNSSKSLQMPRF